MTTHVRAFGSPGGRPFVFWHALGPDASSEYFEDVARVLAAHGFDVYGIDGPGFGSSPLLEPGFRVLDDRERRILHLRFFEGLTQSQIAQQVGISQMHVSRLIRRALEKIREEIAADELDPDRA